MAFKTPLTRYRPSRVFDGAGGLTETMGAGVIVYAVLELHSNRLSAVVDHQEDVLVGDVIADDTDARYRVSGAHHLAGTRLRRLDLERMERPIAP